MKAAVCYEHGKPLVVEDIDIDPPGNREVKVRMAATAICHSDIHVLRGELGPELPLVAGHESSGYVEEIGPGVTSVSPGDPVVISLVANCGQCHHCLTGRPHLCQFEWPLETQSRLHNKKGQALIQTVKVGSLAEYTIVDQSQVVRIPETMPMDRAALLGCGVITGFGSVVWRAQVKAMESVVVIGTGGVGLNAIQGAAFTGAHPIIAVDILDAKLEAAKSFGATHTVNAQKGDPVKEVMELTSKRGADYIFVTVGSTHAMQQGFRMSAPRGTTVMVGLPRLADTLTLSPFEFIRTERVLTGSFMGSPNLQVDIPMLVTLYQSGRLKLDELITRRYSLEQVNDAIESVEKGEALRNVIVF